MTSDRWEEWKTILELTPDGKINIDQLKLELNHFDNLADRMCKVTDLITQGKLSYPTYSYETLEEMYYTAIDEAVKDTIKDMIDDLKTTYNIE